MSQEPFKCPQCGRRSLSMPNFRKEREQGHVTVSCSACGLSISVHADDDSEKLDIFGDFLDIYNDQIKAIKEKKVEPDARYEYNTWDPPASTTLFCKMAGVPYQALRSRMASGQGPDEVTAIRTRLDTHRYKCKICVHYGVDSAFCQLKKKTANPEAICKGFEPDLEVPLDS